ncbi:hypothetical protein Syun_013344 [Stephania yunnanensis]|uniref:Uncharacterized protein n=1 Tax=Stephania yunnanensis TaxID=152371 RepID=A0AAP0K1X4_9MAGN
MIHRKWSLLTGPPAILGSIVATLLVFNQVSGLNDTFLKQEKKKEVAASSK